MLTSLKGKVFPKKPCQESLYHGSHRRVTVSKPFNKYRVLLHKYMEKGSREKEETNYLISLSMVSLDLHANKPFLIGCRWSSSPP